MQGSELVRVEPRVGKLVLLAENSIPLGALCRVGVDGQHAERDAHLADRLLVPLEHPAEGGRLLGISRYSLAYLLASQWTRRLDQRGNQVDEPFQAVHPGDTTGPLATDMRPRRAASRSAT